MAGTTPPTKEAKAKKEKAPKPEKATGEKKARGPRTDYGFAPISIIHIVDGEHKFRGDRAEWFKDLSKYDGKTVEKFLNGGNKPSDDPPRGWLRFFVVTAKAATLEAKEEAA
jgi:hypothetical protein